MSSLLSSNRVRFSAIVIFLTVISLTAGCRGIHNREVEGTETARPTAGASLIRMNDAGAEGQLKKGFYAIESGAWRWTAGEFSVVLRTPPGGAANGAVLTFSFVIPGNQLPGQTLTAMVGDVTLKSEKYTQGPHTFTANVTPSLLGGDTITVNFSLDSTLPRARWITGN